MYHWDRDTVGRLQRVSALIEEGCEVSLNNEQWTPYQKKNSRVSKGLM